MRYRWIVGLIVTCIAVAAHAAASPQASDSAKTVIDGRTFNFPVPDMNAPDFYKSIHKDFLIGALNTPSPPRKIWEPFGELMAVDDAHSFVIDYLKNRPVPSDTEVKGFLAHIKANMIFVKGGTFDMGDYGWLTPAHRPMTPNPLSSPPHKVTLDSYSLMKNRVTYADYDIYTRANHLPPVGLEPTAITMRFINFPALVTWQQGRDYCLWLSKLTHQPFDIDNEAQYEYAARSGGKWLFLANTFQKSSEIVPDLNKFSDLMDKMSKDVSPEIQMGVPIGTYGQNYLGFEDMTGTIPEWVYDWFAPYSKEPQVNPRGPVVRPPARPPLNEQKESWGYGNGKVVRAANEDDQGTMSRGDLDPEQPYPTFRCAINSTSPWK